MAYESRLEILIDTRRAHGSLRQLEGDLSRTEAAGTKAFTGLQKGAMAFGAAFAAIGAGAAFKSTISTIVDFQNEMSGLQAVARASVEDLARLEQQARLLGATTAYGANQAAQAQKFLAQGGLEVNQILGATPQVMRLAQAGMLGLGQAADLATDVMAAMSLQVSDIGRIGDVLVATSQAVTTDVAALGEALSYSAGQGADFNLTLEETVAALGLISGTGAKGSRAGTGLVGVIAQLANVTGPGQEILDKYSIALEDLNVSSRGLIPVLETLASAAMEPEERIKLFGQASAGAAGALLNNLPAYKAQIEALQEVNGLAGEAARTMTANLGGAFKGLSSAIAESNLQLGDSGLSATLESLILTGTGVVQIFNGMGDEWAAGTKNGEAYLSTAQSLVSTLEVLAVVAGTRLTTALLSAVAAKGQNLAATQANLTAEAAAASAVARRTAAEALAEKRLLGRAAAEVRATQGTSAHTAALAALNVQRQRAVQASTANTVALNAESAAMARASVAARGLAVAGTAARSALALVGGPLGLLIGAGGLLYAFRDELNITSQRVGLTEDQIMDFRSELSGLANDSFTGILSDLHAELDAATLKAASAREELAALRSERSQGEGARAMFQTLERGGYEAELAGIRAVEEAENRILALDQKLAAAKGEVASRIEQNANAMVVYGERVDTAASQTRLATEATNTLSDATKAANEAERERQRVLDDSISAYADLNKQLSPAGAAMAEYNQTVARLTVAYEDGTKSALEYYAAIGQAAQNYNEAVRAADPNIKRLEELTRQYDSAHLKAQQLTTDLAKINEAWRNDPSNGEQYARMVGNIRDEMQRLALEADPAAQEMARAWEEASNRIDETFADAFAGAFDSFDSFADQLMDGFKRLLSELAYQATLKPIVVGFTQDMQGMMGLPGGSSGGGFGNAIGAAKNLYSAGSSLLGIGGSTASTGFMGSVATQSAGTLYGSAATGSAISASSGGIMSAISSGVSAAMPWIAGGLAIDSLLGGGITKAISGLFGSETKPRLNISTYGDASAFGHESVRNGAFGAVGFSQGTRRSDELFGGIDQEREWLANVAALDNLTVTAGRTAQEVEMMTSAVQHHVISVKDAASANDMLAQRTAAATRVLDADFTQSLLDVGSTAEQIAQRFVSARQAMDVLDAASQRLGLQFNSAAQGALQQADAIAQQVGGTEALANAQSGLYDLMFSEQEKLEHLASDLSGVFGSVGLALPDTTEGLRSLYQGLELATDAGQRQLATVYNNVDGLSEYIRAMDEQRSAAEGAADATEQMKDTAVDYSDAIRAQESLQMELWRAEGNTAAIRQNQIDKLNELAGAEQYGLERMQRRIWAIQDEAEVYSRHLVQAGNVSQLQGAYDAYQASIEASQRGAQLRKEQLENELRAVRSLHDLSNSLMLSSQSILDPLQRMQEAQSQLADLQLRAERGDVDAVSQLQGASTSYLDAAAAYYGQSSEQYAAIFGDVTGSVESLERQFGDSVKSLGSIEGIEQQALREQQRASQIRGSQLQATVDSYGELTSISQLLELLPSELANALSSAVGAAAGGASTGGSSARSVSSSDIRASVASVTGANGYISDAGARNLYNAALNNGVSLSEVQKHLPAGNDAAAWAQKNGLPLFADGGYTGPGGKYDPAGIVHAEEIVWSQSDIARAGGVGVVESMRKGGVSIPPIQQFPLLNAQDATQVMRDMQRTIERQGQQIAELLKRGNEHTGQTRDAVVAGNNQASQQRAQQLGEQRKINKNVKVRPRP